MKTKVSPVVVGVAVVLLAVFCIFMYIRANSAVGPNQLPPPTETFKPGYNAGGDRSAGPNNRSTGRPAPGAATGTPGH